MSVNLSKYQNKKKTNFIKKMFEKIKENFMCDEIKNNVKIELLEPLYVEIKNIILPHYIIFIILFIIIIFLLLYLIITITNKN